MSIFNRIRHILFFVLLGAIITGLFSYSFFGKEVSMDDARAFTDSLGLWLPISFIIFYTLVSIILPTTPLMAIAGILFGFRYGMIYVTIGGFLSALITFYTARLLGKDFIENLLHKKFFNKLETYNEKIAQRGISTVAILRMTPIMPFNILNLLMGISKVTSSDYIIGTVVGLLPSNALTVYFGKLILELVTGRVASALLGTFILATSLIVVYKNRNK